MDTPHDPRIALNGTEPQDAIDWRASQLADLQATLAAGHGEAAVDRFTELLLERLVDEGTLAVAFEPAYLEYARTVRQMAPHLYHRITMQLRTVRGLYVPGWEKMVETLPHTGHINDFPDPISMTDLLAKEIPPPKFLIEKILCDGLTLFAGKSKRGKSWIMLDIAIAIAAGQSAFRHYRTLKSPVLYLALEDGEGRVQRRAREIQPTLLRLDTLHIYTQKMPRLGDGFLDVIAEKHAKFGYQLIIIDVLAKIAPKNRGPRSNEYQDTYDDFEGLQAFVRQHQVAVIVLDHLRKSDITDDCFENILGSTAKQGVPDNLWVLERKPKDTLAFLHLRTRDQEETTIGIEFKAGHWEYLGEGEEFEHDREQQTILRILHEEQRELQILDIQRAAGWMGDARYARLRKVLMRMVKDDLIHRTQHGKYAATIRSAFPRDKQDDIPF